MPDSARTGVLVYAKNLQLVSRFYERVLAGKAIHADGDHQVLQLAETQLIIHAIPPPIANSISIGVPPEPREDQAIKPFFTVASLAAAGQIAVDCGGLLCGPVWDGPGIRVRNVCDPEGNIIQLCENAA